MKNIDMNKFKPYVVVDDATSSKAVTFTTFYKTAEEANEVAQSTWEGLTDYDKRGNRHIYVGYVTPEMMDLDLIDEDDELDYDRPPWNCDSDVDPNGVVLFDSKLYGKKQKMLATAFTKEPLSFDGAEYWVMEEPKPNHDNPLQMEALAILKDDSLPYHPYVNTYMVTWMLPDNFYDENNVFDDFCDEWSKPFEVRDLKQDRYFDWF